jgi:hypothetical protein
MKNEVRDKNGVVAKRGDIITYYALGGVQRTTTRVLRVKRPRFDVKPDHFLYKRAAIETEGPLFDWLHDGEFEIEVRLRPYAGESYQSA